MRTALLSFLLVLISACSKPEVEAKPADPAPAASTSPSAPAAASVSAAPSASGAPSASATVVASAAPSAPAGTKSAPSAPTGPTCGVKPLPDCPLQAWMKANTAPAMAAADMPGLAAAFDQIVKLAPPGYPNWTSIAKDGARAAREAQLDAVKAACRGCHDQYKTKYKTEIRSRALP